MNLFHRITKNKAPSRMGKHKKQEKRPKSDSESDSDSDSGPDDVSVGDRILKDTCRILATVG